jgi:hypothetical protein
MSEFASTRQKTPAKGSMDLSITYDPEAAIVLAAHPWESS